MLAVAVSIVEMIFAFIRGVLTILARAASHPIGKLAILAILTLTLAAGLLGSIFPGLNGWAAWGVLGVVAVLLVMK